MIKSLKALEMNDDSQIKVIGINKLFFKGKENYLGLSSLQHKFVVFEDFQKIIVYIFEYTTQSGCIHIRHDDVVDIILKEKGFKFLGAGILNWEQLNAQFHSNTCRDKFGFDRPENKQEEVEILSFINRSATFIRNEFMKN